MNSDYPNKACVRSSYPNKIQPTQHPGMLPCERKWKKVVGSNDWVALFQMWQRIKGKG